MDSLLYTLPLIVTILTVSLLKEACLIWLIALIKAISFLSCLLLTSILLGFLIVSTASYLKWAILLIGICLTYIVMIFSVYQFILDFIKVIQYKKKDYDSDSPLGRKLRQEPYAGVFWTPIASVLLLGVIGIPILLFTSSFETKTIGIVYFNSYLLYTGIFVIMMVLGMTLKFHPQYQISFIALEKYNIFK